MRNDRSCQMGAIDVAKREGCCKGEASNDEDKD